MNAKVSTEQLKLISGLIAHVASYLGSRCPRAAHEAGMLLRELDALPIDQELNRSCEQLEQAIANSSRSVWRIPGHRPDVMEER